MFLQFLKEYVMSKMPWEMSFDEFYANAKPSGAVNRLPGIGRGGEPVYSYVVNMNGSVEQDLPENSREFDYNDVMVKAVTKNLGLDPKNFRDNLKVAELAAARSAWMDSVSQENARSHMWNGNSKIWDERNEVPLSEAIAADYELLTKGMVHPCIQNELDKQHALTKGLKPVLDKASEAVGVPVADLSPTEVSIGKVVASSMDFTVQQTSAGEIVTHENRRLESIPKIGDEVTVSYYRGTGQVVDSLENVKVSAPFVDKKSGDLAICLTDGNGVDQVVLFNSLSGFDKFVKAHGLDDQLVEQAIDARIANPKEKPALPEIQVTSDVYLDEPSGMLSFDYSENGVGRVMMFGSAWSLEKASQEFGISQDEIVKARQMEVDQKQTSYPEWYASFETAKNKAIAASMRDVTDSGKHDKSYSGMIIADSKLHVAQHVGKASAVIHCKHDLDKVPLMGDRIVVNYKEGQGQVKDSREQGRSLEKGQGRV